MTEPIQIDENTIDWGSFLKVAVRCRRCKGTKKVGLTICDDCDDRGMEWKTKLKGGALRKRSLLDD